MTENMSQTPARRWSVRRALRRFLAAYTAVADTMQGLTGPDGRRPHR